MNVLQAIQKSIYVFKKEGVYSLIKKVVRKIRYLQILQNRTIKDFLFINGCELPHPYRYRVLHQIEQLEFNNVTVDNVFYKDLKLSHVNHYRGFVFFRTAYEPLFETFIQKAKSMNKKVFFDLDDAVFDLKYTNEIPYIQQMGSEDKQQYNEGVLRIGKLLKMCDTAITSTIFLSNLIKEYCPDVIVNRNVASQEMVFFSETALRGSQANKNLSKKFVISYFSGSITHKDNFDLISPCLLYILNKYSHVELLIVGILELNEEIKQYKNRITILPFVDFQKLPDIMASADVCLAPLMNMPFNHAKSENKWTEAALVKVPTIASNVGGFKEVIEHNKNGVLCETTEEWGGAIERMIVDEKWRIEIAENAYRQVMNKHVTIKTGYKISEELNKRMSLFIVFLLPSLQISGGINVILKHAVILKKSGKVDVFLLNNDISYDSQNLYIDTPNELVTFTVLEKQLDVKIDCAVATLWTTAYSLSRYFFKIKTFFYLVQSKESGFYNTNDRNQLLANSTYNLFCKVQYVTISKWCLKWLQEEFNKQALFIPNGIDIDGFRYRYRETLDRNKKIKILIEGDYANPIKNVEESFKIAIELKNDFDIDIHYLSYGSKPSNLPKGTIFYSNIPNTEVGAIYRNCDILIKSSYLESFSYPPLEMMTTGGFCIVAENEGNIEYLKHEYNCLLYKLGDIDIAVQLVKQLIEDKHLQNKIVKGGQETAQNRSWCFIEQTIIDTYSTV